MSTRPLIFAKTAVAVAIVAGLTLATPSLVLAQAAADDLERAFSAAPDDILLNDRQAPRWADLRRRMGVSTRLEQGPSADASSLDLMHAPPASFTLGAIAISRLNQVRPAGAGRSLPSAPADQTSAAGQDATSSRSAGRRVKTETPPGLKAGRVLMKHNPCKEAPKHKLPAACVIAPPAPALASVPATPDDWRAHFQPLRGLAPADQVHAVDRLVNALPYVSDLENWGVADYWETPEEMFARGGDCEGFALTKYFALRDLGLPDEALRVAVVWDRRDREEHAILLARIAGETWILDNKTEQPLRLADDAGRYQLIYSVNEAGARLASALPVRAGAPKPRARVVNGGRTLVMTVAPRSRRAGRTAPPIGIAPLAPAGADN